MFVLRDLPGPWADACSGVVRALDLRYGAIDLIEDGDGCMHFLECNPNGQYGWLEQELGLPTPGSPSSAPGLLLVRVGLAVAEPRQRGAEGIVLGGHLVDRLGEPPRRSSWLCPCLLCTRAPVRSTGRSIDGLSRPRFARVRHCGCRLRRRCLRRRRGRGRRCDRLSRRWRRRGLRGTRSLRVRLRPVLAVRGGRQAGEGGDRVGACCTQYVAPPPMARQPATTVATAPGRTPTSGVGSTVR